MSPESQPLLLDLADFDAVGIASDVVVSVRRHAIQSRLDSSATISAPESWHRVMINCSPTGKTLLRVRFTDLTTSRSNNVAKALAERSWQTDEDGDGAALRFPSGVEATTVAFDALAALTLAGAPSDVRSVTASDSEGHSITL